MSFPRYPTYKDSGVEWLGEVPGHWRIQRLKFVCDIQTGSRDTENAVDGGEFPFFVRSQIVERIDSCAFDCEAVLTAGDGAGVGKVFHHYTGPFDFHQRVYMLSNFRGVSGRFIYHYLRENFYKVALEGGAKSTVDSLRRPMFTNFAVALPPEDEQDLLIAFVDTESARIDALVSEQERLIELLREKRHAVISHAVTKGLDPNVPMTDSGVAWLGEVPAHWAVARLGRTLAHGPRNGVSPNVSRDGNRPSFSTAAVSNGRVNIKDNVKFIDLSDDDAAPFLVANGDLLVLRGSGSKERVGEAGIVDTDPPPGCVFPDILIRIRLGSTWLSAYGVELLNSGAVRPQMELEAQTAAGIWKVSGGSLRDLVVPQPPIAEQEAITAFLDSETAQIDTLITSATHAITLLQERRSALITAAVTGQIDVRGVA